MYVNTSLELSSMSCRYECCGVMSLFVCYTYMYIYIYIYIYIYMYIYHQWCGNSHTRQI